MKLFEIEEALALSKEYRIFDHFLTNDGPTALRIGLAYDNSGIIRTMLTDLELDGLGNRFKMSLNIDQAGFSDLKAQV